MAEIMVLDDVADVGVMIRRILGRQGHRVHIFSDEAPAFEHARKSPPHLAILDMKLKKMSGVEVLRELKKINAGIRVMMLTGYPTLETAEQCLQLGADAYCVKPIEIDELEAKTARILAKAVGCDDPGAGGQPHAD
ncbi:response regulator [Desulfatitalea alkaliphila]|uniref:Response regulator n=1 Tax=Desulfatitalea alkaliphila TaxID=2929485 RepID=A0AA41R8I3_9BACT|nr:response regulator [Desulfatitalea alkaliphila]MCJ8500843.1 response regulator [Desulfatitalea alkaliphila]